MTNNYDEEETKNIQTQVIVEKVKFILQNFYDNYKSTE